MCFRYFAPFVMKIVAFSISTKFLNDMLGKLLFDFSMSWDRLTFACLAILIPIVPPAMANQHTTRFFNFAD
jgi:hypothetical protein